MARTVQVHLLDDLDGSPADETITFNLDGLSYDIDLSTAHAEQLRTGLARYIVAGRRIARAQTVRGVPGTRTPARTDKAQNQAVRVWAKAQKMELSDRGRIPRSILEKYNAEAGH